jgi:multisubunit Na+/H+ antiporter MnhG subunit
MTAEWGTERSVTSTVEGSGDMVLAVVLIVLAILLGLGGLVFTALKWLLIVAVVLLVAGVVMGFIARGRARSLH